MSNLSLYQMRASICQTLAEPQRLEIIDRLRDDEKSVTELAEAMEIGRSNPSRGRVTTL